MKGLVKTLKAKVILEIEIGEDIIKKYPNFSINYANNEDFLVNLVSSFEHNSKLDECEVFINLHPAFGDVNYDYNIYDDGYKVIVKDVKINKG